MAFLLTRRAIVPRSLPLALWRHLEPFLEPSAADEGGGERLLLLRSLRTTTLTVFFPPEPRSPLSLDGARLRSSPTRRAIFTNTRLGAAPSRSPRISFLGRWVRVVLQGAEHVVVVVRGTAGGGEDVAEVDLVVHVPVDAHSRAGCEW